ncbi:MAG: hypothetical protein KAS32_00125 [Candidatus Peribacteraceae bacterium]|nr:hypothetical protein [Candidatus Peribacteraceae bacterium]
MVIKIEVKGLPKAFGKGKFIVEKEANTAIKASLFEVLKRSSDGGRGGLFRFKTSRSQRTGRLALSMRTNIVTKNLFGSIGPNVTYDDKVHRKNQFMPRIFKASKRDIDKHFQQSIERITRRLAGK